MNGIGGRVPVPEPPAGVTKLSELKARRARLMDQVQAIDDEAAQLVAELQREAAEATAAWQHVVPVKPVFREGDPVTTGRPVRDQPQA